MRIYLVRHGKAAKEGYAVDEERPLTKRGRKDVELIAARLAGAKIELTQIRHSGLVRARETAEIFQQQLIPPGGMIQVAGLLWDDPVDQVARELRLEPEPVMLVGHNPFMERLAGALLTGDPNQTPIHFSTSSTVCFEYDMGVWTVRWALCPEIVPEA